MSGQTSARMIEAMKLVLAKVTPYAAAQRTGIALGTMYKSRLYKMWRDSAGDQDKLAALRREMDVTRPLPRKPGKQRKLNN